MTERLPLTDRELSVLQGMSAGHSNGQIGRTLYLSEDTIKTHARRLFRKLGARDRAHAVHLGHLAGILTGAPVPRVPAAAAEDVAPTPRTEPQIELRDCSHHVELCTFAFFPSSLNRPVARQRAAEGLRRLLGTVSGS